MKGGIRQEVGGGDGKRGGGETGWYAKYMKKFNKKEKHQFTDSRVWS